MHRDERDGARQRRWVAITERGAGVLHVDEPGVLRARTRRSVRQHPEADQEEPERYEIQQPKSTDERRYQRQNECN